MDRERRGGIILAVVLLFLLLAVLILLFGIGAFNQENQNNQSNNQGQGQIEQNIENQRSFSNEANAPRLVDSIPSRGSTFTEAPINVATNFNEPLSRNSNITIKKEGINYDTGNTIIDTNRQVMRKRMVSDAPDGLYTVDYWACGQDGQCQYGSFQFRIDRRQTAGFTDLRGQRNVIINIEGSRFNPQNVIISRGTRVLWINKDNTPQSVNTNPITTHIYYPIQNSNPLGQGATYTLIFPQIGAYPYHNAMNSDIGQGIILVR
ncbi:copper resistance protein CopC [Methanobacterium sp. ACI-7]|uniref:copper resistance protein CopC n=1 Tax=unclassified Methanobacterium TaxID=2627676 RepID=UPI0039C4C4C1